jgi:hypothetical protein
MIDFKEYALAALNVNESFMTFDDLDKINKKHDADLKYKLSNISQELNDLFKQYIQYNDKKLISKIVELIEKDEEFHRLVDIENSLFKKVYRGLAIEGEVDLEKILEGDRTRELIATSTNRDKAIEYAEGHVKAFASQDKESTPILITYGVDSWDVILNVGLFSKYIDEGKEEDEVVISARDLRTKPSITKL